MKLDNSKQLLLKIPRGLHSELKQFAAKHGRSMTDIVVETLKDRIGSKPLKVENDG